MVKWIEHAYGECLVHFGEEIFDVALESLVDLPLLAEHEDELYLCVEDRVRTALTKA